LQSLSWNRKCLDTLFFCCLRSFEWGLFIFNILKILDFSIIWYKKVAFIFVLLLLVFNYWKLWLVIDSLQIIFHLFLPLFFVLLRKISVWFVSFHFLNFIPSLAIILIIFSMQLLSFLNLIFLFYFIKNLIFFFLILRNFVVLNSTIFSFIF
jgi:hypothetical protein